MAHGVEDRHARHPEGEDLGGREAEVDVQETPRGLADLRLQTFGGRARRFDLKPGFIDTPGH